ncbi:MAG: hypothetical protein DYG89_02340 [Caldilinea sp. CFX5]|nr:hypothetical protein [Caldilinea sp. CFX5]
MKAPGSLINRRGMRAVLFSADLFVALTAIGGGIALVAGLEANRFPLAWLQGTPFTNYVIPGLILTVVVGGSAAIAAVLMLRSSASGARASRLAGLIMMGWIAGEVLILNQPVAPQGIEIFYFMVGLAMALLGWLGAKHQW